MTRRNTPSLAAVLRDAIDARMADMHVALPARVESYDAARQAVSVQPLIRRGYIDESGERATERLPVINDVPVVFPGAGGFRVTFPVVAGDVVLLVFSEASIDHWLVRGGEVDPGDDRRNALSDAIAIPGLRPFRNPLSSAPTDAMTAGMDGGPVIEFDGSEIRIGGAPSEPTILGTTYRSAEDTMLIALSNALAGLAGVVALGAPVQGACSVAAAAITTFRNGASGYLTSTAKVK